MQVPLEIVFRDMEPPGDAKSWVQECADELERVYERITSCRVAVEEPRIRHRDHGLYRVRVDVTLPGHELVVHREPPRDVNQEDLHGAIRDAFELTRRRLREQVLEMRGRVKRHQAPAAGRVATLFGEYGFIATPAGDVYFHRNAVLDGFDELQVGDEVRFVEEDGRKGPQATSVRRVGRHHHLL